MKSIKEQILQKAKMHMCLFTCWGFSLLSAALGGSWEVWLASGFVVTALIDFDK